MRYIHTRGNGHGVKTLLSSFFGSCEIITNASCNYQAKSDVSLGTEADLAEQLEMGQHVVRCS